MTELKTLKDLPFCAGSDWNPTGTDVSVEDLRAEAIKWVKNLQSDSYVYGSNNVVYSMRDAVIMINWIKHFFALTEEDLK